MTMAFSINRWVAWAPGLTEQDAWTRWFSEPHSLPAEGTPPLSEMPAMMRRRVERLGRFALQAAYGCQGDSPSVPVIFASRFGDISRSVDLLRQLAHSVPLSPTSFSLSVHNAIGALYSIARGDTSAYTAIAAGEETVEAAFTEASALLADGARDVLVVIYDEPLPGPLGHASGQMDFPRAWACWLRAGDEAPGYSLTCHPAKDTRDAPSSDGLPEDLTVLRFLVSGEARLDHKVGTRCWRWQRHA
ncbi:beta-ketoacyl synthase chain length factor [Archangium sp. Cb G35]|uniref:beta-ketoacyl synthase chain length factor n=1 Tax=Archangium sp. Cb G35 TaxID=1920190 RepID=UPI001E480F37|nr:beta-ketoacyl synthase chain length factor [Archangium sp. Cb G35]